MAFLKLLIFSLLFSLIFTKITSNVVSDPDTTFDENQDVKFKASDSSLRLELELLKSKISILESSIVEKTLELRSEDEKVNELENKMEMKLAKLSSLQSELQLIQERGSLNAKELNSKANVHASELEQQIDVLRTEIEAQNKKKDSLETSTVAEEKTQELDLKLEKLQRINEEQKARIRKTKEALQLAEEEMMKAKMEASSISKQLEEVSEGWLPPWLAVHLVHFRSVFMTHWNEHGRPALALTIRKALETKSEVVKLVEHHVHLSKTKWIPIMKERSVEFVRDVGPHVQTLKSKTLDFYHVSKKYMERHMRKAQELIDLCVQKWIPIMKERSVEFVRDAGPHVQMLKSKSIDFYHASRKYMEHHIVKAREVIDICVQKWIPIMKERSVEFVRDAGPHIQMLKSKTVDFYHASKKYMEPHIVKAREVIDHFVQEGWKFAYPYVDQITPLVKPHFGKARIFLEPYTKKVHRYYRKFKKSVSLYHHQAQENIHQILKNHEFTKPYATKELAWFLASGLLALPVIFLFNLASDLVSKKPKKRSRSHHTSHTRRKAKRHTS